eukprot:scaffold23382_cov82-Skeletonema_marinoi.AAC.1
MKDPRTVRTIEPNQSMIPYNHPLYDLRPQAIKLQLQMVFTTSDECSAHTTSVAAPLIDRGLLRI